MIDPEKLYDSATSKTSAGEDVKPAPTPDDDLAQKLYGPKPALPAIAVPEGVATLRESSRSIYKPESAFSDITETDLIGPAPAHGHTPEQKAHVLEMKRMMADLNISNREAHEIVALTRQLLADPPDQETVAKWGAAANRRLLDLNDQDQKKATSDLRLAAADPTRSEMEGIR